jgi:hypothetical protein
MYIDKVNISETFEMLGDEKVLRWQKIEASVVLKEGENSMQGANYIQDFINEWNKKGNEPKTIAVVPIDAAVEEKQILDWIANCTSRDKLESTYKFVARKYASTKLAYLAKEKELTNERT